MIDPRGTLRGIAITALLLGALTLPSAAFSAQAGESDTTFGVDGFVSVSVDPGAEPVLRDLVRLPDGSLIASGGSRVDESGILTKVLPDGTLDPSFGTGGLAKTPTSLWASVFPIEGGKLVAFGRVGSNPAIARFNEDGSLDQGFGETGIRRLELRGLFGETEAILATDGPGVDAEGRIVAVVQMPCSLDDEGDEVVPPQSVVIGGDSVCGNTAVVRLTPDGDLDSSFGGGDGLRVVALAGSEVRSSLAEDGSILLATVYSDGDEYTWVEYWSIRRLQDNGLPDLSFGDSGWFVRTQHDRRVGILEGDEDGNVIVSNGQKVMRLLPSGEPDPRFGTDGVAPTAGRYLQSRLWLYFTDGAVTDSHIYLAGVGTQPRDDSRHAIVARLNLDGNPDPTFSNDGLATRRVSPVFSSEMTQRRIGLLGGSVVVDESGRATVGTTGKEGENLTFTLSRFLGGDGQGLQLTCGGKPATVQGTPGDDVLEAGAITAAGAGDDVIHGGGGLICAGEGNDSVEGRAQEVNLGPGDDLIRNKQIRRDPLVLGGSGDDRVLGRFDRAFGGPGDDLIDTTWPKDRGFYLETSSLAGGPGRDRIKSGEGRDLLMGGDGPDLLGSGADEDSLLGGGGRDSLFGGAGADRLIGGPGWDELEGGDPGPRYRRYYVDTPKAKGLLEVLPGKIARAQARFLQGCVGPPEIRSFWRESSELEEATIRNGRFRESRFEDYPNPFGAEEWSREILRGEIRRDSVRLEIAITDRSEGLECRTGKLRVTFNRIADLRQVEAQ